MNISSFDVSCNGLELILFRYEDGQDRQSIIRFILTGIARYYWLISLEIGILL
jgi:hypothetical protein